MNMGTVEMVDNNVSFHDQLNNDKMNITEIASLNDNNVITLDPVSNRKQLKTSQGSKLPNMNVELVGLQTINELQEMKHVTPTHFSAISEHSIYGRSMLTPLTTGRPGFRNQGNMKFKNIDPTTLMKQKLSTK